jgi:hypothetical protein
MNEGAPFEVIITEDNHVAVNLSDHFVSLPLTEQLKVVEEFFWKKSLEPQDTLDVGSESVKNEITIVLAESMMAQLKRGERFEKDGQIDISLEDLTNLWNISA